MSDFTQPMQIAKKFLEKYYITTDIYNDIYIYNNKYWQIIPRDYLKSLINCDSQVQKNTVIDCILSEVHQDKIRWNQIKKEEIAFSNGLYNLLTDSLQDLKYSYYLNSIIPHNYKNEKQCPLWLQCLDNWFETENKKLISQEFFGYLLCSHADYKKALIISGKSNTYNSLFYKIAKFMIGEEFVCYICPENMSCCKELARIKNKRLNLAYPSQLTNEGFKQIISGESIQIDKQYTGFEMIVPVAKHIFICDKLPEIRDFDDINNRLIILQFNKTFDSNQNSDLQEKLQLEIEGIIVWAMEGLKRLIKNNGQFTNGNLIV